MLKRYPLNRDGVFIENFALENKLWRTLLALQFATQHYRGMKRDDSSNEIDHSTRGCCDLIDRGILYLAPTIGLETVDIILAVILLHDIIENAKVLLAEIGKLFGKEIAYNVDLVTKWPELKKNVKKYYRRISRSVIAILVKSVDKENVAGTIVDVAKTPRRLRRQANDVEMLLPIMKKARNKHPEYKGILISCRNHLKDSLLGIKKLISAMYLIEKLKKENDELNIKLRRRQRRKKTTKHKV
jgi:(p)ppGpp synthase/HD superfamily hydrolase